MTVERRAPRRWRKPPAIRNPWLRWGLIVGGVAYLLLAVASLEVDAARIAQGWERAWFFLSGLFTPDFGARWNAIVDGVLESLTMTVTATAVGVLLSVPLALGAARNLAPAPVYALCRAFIVVARTFPEIVIAIFFVILVSFGPFAGFLTLTFASMGFIGKLLAEDIEDVDATQLEAVRASGASWLQVVGYAVVPQVMPRFVGLSLYRFDINFRASTVLGLVGAGGIGATLNTAIERYEYSVAGAVLLVIIAIVLAVELVSGEIRKRVQ